MTTLILENEVWAALERIYDPCSIATRSPINMVDMGLVREVEVDDAGDVRIRVNPTAPSCMLMGSMIGAARKEMETIEGLGKIEVEVDADFFWTPEAMTERGQAELSRHREARSGEAPVPYAHKRQKAAI
jgi:metal-sulfur cluster biosynthetic enzyme